MFSLRVEDRPESGIEEGIILEEANHLFDGIETVATFLTDDVGVDDSSFSLRDASGLSPTNLVSPRTVVAVLSYAMSSKWGPTLLGNLAAPGSGTLAGWLARMEAPEFPVAIGVLYCDPAESYEAAVERQIEDAKEKAPEASLNSLLQSGHTWTVEPH